MNNFLICFPTPADKIEDTILDKETGEFFLKSILMTLDRIDCEKNTMIWIEKINKDNFINDLKTLESLLNLNIRIGAYNMEDLLLHFINNNSIRIVGNNPQDFHFILKSNAFDEVDKIFEDINQQRKINRNDFRHCENHPDFIEGKSPLIGGLIGFDNAEKLLATAIGDAKTKKEILINIDEINKNFIIRFESENFDNQYHPYHIVQKEIITIGKKKETNYVEDSEKIKLIKTSRGIPRAYKLIYYKKYKR